VDTKVRRWLGSPGSGAETRIDGGAKENYRNIVKVASWPKCGSRCGIQGALLFINTSGFDHAISALPAGSPDRL
jgi:hypothetical protein